jgi:HEAT repeat protein
MSTPILSERSLVLIAGLLTISIPVGAQPSHTKRAAQLSREMSDSRAEVRRRAAEDLSGLGFEAIPAVTALSAALKDDDTAVRAAAALAISKIGPEAASAVQNLTTLLKDRDPSVRRRAAEALHSIGPAAKPAVDALRDALKDDATGNPSSAALALGRIGESAIPALIEALSHRDADTRGRAALGLRALGPKARKAVPALAAALGDSDDWVRRYACWALGSIGADAKDALPALRHRLKDVNLHFQFDAAEAMLLIDATTAGPVEVLKAEAMLRTMPLYAASGLALIPAEAETALPILIKALEEEGPIWRRDMAIMGVGRLGPKIATPAVPKLRAIARNGQGVNRVTAAEALTTLVGKPDELLLAIDQELASTSSERRAAGLKALARLGPQGLKLAEGVIPLLRDNDWAVREAARSAMHRIDPSRAKGLMIRD